MRDDIAKILLHESTILARLDELAYQITQDYRDKPLTVIGILNGSCLFLADLLRRIPIPLQIDCLSIASYHGRLASSGKITFRQSELPNVANRHVLLVDDILDTGETLQAVCAKINALSPLSLRTCVLLKKDVPRPKNVEADYVGFAIPNEFVVGYGLDYQQHYRNLPFIGVLNAEAIANPSRL